LQTRSPSLSSSPRIRSAPHSRLAWVIWRIKAIVSAVTLPPSLGFSRPPPSVHLAVPSQEGGGLHNEQRPLPSLRDARRGHHPPPVAAGEAWSGHFSAQHEELLAEQRVLGHEFGARPQSIAGHADELPQCVAPEQRGEVKRHGHGSGQPRGARGMRHPGAIGEGRAAVKGFPRRQPSAQGPENRGHRRGCAK
jgi:hypothetical protein